MCSEDLVSHGMKLSDQLVSFIWLEPKVHLYLKTSSLV